MIKDKVTTLLGRLAFGYMRLVGVVFYRPNPDLQRKSLYVLKEL